MKEEYKKQLSQIKAPRSLIDKTKAEMKKLEQQNNEQQELEQEQAERQSSIASKEKETTFRNIEQPETNSKETYNGLNEYPTAAAEKSLFEQKQQAKRKSRLFLRGVTAAAVILFGIGGYAYWQSLTPTVVSITVESSEFMADQYFGQNGTGTAKDSIQVMKGKSEKVIPDFLRKTRQTRLEGVEVWLARDENGIYHGGYQKDAQYFYIVGKNTTEEAFISFLKKKF